MGGGEQPTVEPPFFDTFSENGALSDISAGSSTGTSGKHSIASIKARVALILMERSKMAPPAATDKYPKPPDDAKCRLCMRVFALTPNPLVGSPCPFLEVSRPRSAICKSCRNAMNWAFKGRKQQELEDEVQSSPDDFGKLFFLIVLLWEDRHNNPSSTTTVKVFTDLPDSMRGRVLTERSTAIETELMLGIFWPIPVFVKHMKRQPAKNELSVVQHNSTWHKGVVREPCHGTPIGTIRLTQKSIVKQLLELEHESTDTAVRGLQQVEETFHALEKKMGINLQLASDEAGSMPSISMKAKVDDEDPLDKLWSTPFTKKPFAKARSSPGGPSGKRHSGSKAQHELNITEQALLRARQLCTSLKQPQALESVTLKQVVAVHGLLHKRTSNALMEYYAADYEAPDGSTGRAGMDILSDVREMEAKIDLWKQIIERRPSYQYNALYKSCHLQPLALRSSQAIIRSGHNGSMSSIRLGTRLHIGPDACNRRYESL